MVKKCVAGVGLLVNTAFIGFPVNCYVVDGFALSDDRSSRLHLCTVYSEYTRTYSTW